MIAKRLGKFPHGIESYFSRLNIVPTEINKRLWYTNDDFNRLVEYTNSFSDTSSMMSLYDISEKLKLDYGTVKRCADYLNINPHTDIHNKKYYSSSDFESISNFTSSHTDSERQIILAQHKWGTANPMKNKETVRKCISTKLKLSPENMYSTSKICEIFNRDKTTIVKLYDHLGIVPVFAEGCYHISSQSFETLKKYFELTQNHEISVAEKEIVEFIESIYDGEIITNSRKIIPPKELDIYIPSKKLAIEFNGLYWHSSVFVDKSYHLEKTLACNALDIDLIHIFEDEWIFHKEIIKSMIASRLGIYKTKIFARKCTVREVDVDTARKFFNLNHLMGFARGNVYLALVHNEMIVQMIVFNFKGFHDGNVELTRMATAINTQVIGGFSRLIVNFCNRYDITSLVSYIDRSKFNGNGYISVGFRIISDNPPSYHYIVNGKREHKSRYRKARLKFLHDSSLLKYWNENDTEKSIMEKNGYYRIYDCGTVKVEYSVKKS